MNMSIDEIKDICVQIAINGVHIDARSIPPRRRWMSRRWHARPTPVEEAIRRLPASSLAWRI